MRDIKLLKCGRNKVHNNLGKMVAGLRDEVQFMVNCAKAENQVRLFVSSLPWCHLPIIIWVLAGLRDATLQIIT